VSSIPWEAISGISVATTAVLAVLLKMGSDKRRELERRLFSRKERLYLDFMDQVFKFALAKKQINKSELVRWKSYLMLIGSKEVMKAFQKWTVFAMDQQKHGLMVLKGFAELARAMRSDLGNPASGLSDKELLSLFITDLDKHPEIFR